MSKTDTLEWIEVDGDAFSNVKTQKSYDAYREANQLAKDARLAFCASAENDLRKAKMVSAGKEVKWSFRFGKVSYAEAEPTAAKRASAKAIKV